MGHRAVAGLRSLVRDADRDGDVTRKAEAARTTVDVPGPHTGAGEPGPFPAPAGDVPEPRGRPEVEHRRGGAVPRGAGRWGPGG